MCHVGWLNSASRALPRINACCPSCNKSNIPRLSLDAGTKRWYRSSLALRAMRNGDCSAACANAAHLIRHANQSYRSEAEIYQRGAEGWMDVAGFLVMWLSDANAACRNTSCPSNTGPFVRRRDSERLILQVYPIRWVVHDTEKTTPPYPLPLQPLDFVFPTFTNCATTSPDAPKRQPSWWWGCNTYICGPLSGIWGRYLHWVRCPSVMCVAPEQGGEW